MGCLQRLAGLKLSLEEGTPDRVFGAWGGCRVRLAVHDARMQCGSLASPVADCQTATMELNSRVHCQRAASSSCSRGALSSPRPLPRSSSRAYVTVVHSVAQVDRSAVQKFERPDKAGRYGQFGGRYVPETLIPALLELEQEYAKASKDPAYQVSKDPAQGRHFQGNCTATASNSEPMRSRHARALTQAELDGHTHMPRTHAHPHMCMNALPLKQGQAV